MSQRTLHTTDDGSCTLYVPEIDEHYHSTKGALTESLHIFIAMALRHHLSPSPRVLEIGLGTGLNCLLTLWESRRTQRPVHYTSIELYPLAVEQVLLLNYPHRVAEALSLSADEEALLTADFAALHSAPWGEDVQLSEHFTLHKVEADYTQHTFATPFDVVYFDAFSPEKQPEMWSAERFSHLYGQMADGGILTTYCAKGVVRRTLQSVGFAVERLAGPVGGKREILRGTKAD